MKNVNKTTTIGEIKNKYSPALSVAEYNDISPRGRDGVFNVFIDSIDLELLIAFVIKKEREFVMAHPEYILDKKQELRIKNYVDRRLKNEPLAYILGEKEFYGLSFKVTPCTLTPRPETELMVEMAIQSVIGHQSSVIRILDIGTGSGNIIISILKNLKIDSKFKIQNSKFFGTDISLEALKIAKQNAKLHNVHKEIKFLHGDLLDPFLSNLQTTSYKLQATPLLILANLPYLSRDIYNACADNVKKYEPKTALYSPKRGLAHYEKLFSQIKKILPTTSYKLQTTLLLEISPEQKKLLPSIIKKYFPKAKIEFKKDLAQKWRVCKVKIH